MMSAHKSYEALRELIAGRDVPHTLIEDAGELNGCPAPYVVVGGVEAIDAWEALRALVPETGSWPVLLGHYSTHGQVVEAVSSMDKGEDYCPFSPEDTNRLIQEGSAFDLDAWIAENDASEDDDEFDEDEDDEDDDEMSAAFFQPIEPQSGYTIHTDVLTNKPYDMVAILLCPTDIPWQVPAYLKCSAGNYDMDTDVFVGFLKSWYERYGAEIVGWNGATLELKVTRPCNDTAEAAALAREQYAFCFDLVEQGYLSLERLEQSLLGASSWYFWWD